jgi:hypothetical protein
MTAPRSLDEYLAKARLVSPEYTADELAAAQARLTARATQRLMSGALTFDDVTGPDLCAGYPRQEQWPAPADDDDAETRDRLEAASDLQHLCKIVISQDNALHAMSALLSGRPHDASLIPEPDGARVLACILHLAGREDSARFWWQFAAGAEDGLARFCLFLHHLALGELQEANWWHDQVPSSGRGMWARAVREGRDQETAAAATCLHAVARHKAVPEATNAVVVYVKSAIQFVDDEDIPLPLPPDGFAQRIEEMTAGV